MPNGERGVAARGPAACCGAPQHPQISGMTQSGTDMATTAPDVPALAIEGLGHSFGKRKALDGVSLTLRPGEFCVLLGPNGAGKTTLFALATRLYHGRQGAIRIHGHDLKRNPSAALKRVGAVFQQPALDLDLSIEQNLHYHAALHGIARREAAARIDSELDKVELASRHADKVRELSAGQRRRVEIARALLHRPSLLLLDEPTVGLDIASRHQIYGQVRALCRERAVAALWATHLIDEAERDAKVIVLHEGKVRARGTPDEIVAAAGAGSLRDAFLGLTARAA